MKHEEFNLRYNEIMFDERDLIEKFLNAQADLRYGRQMFEWTLEPMPVLTATNGSLVQVREIRLDKNNIVSFLVYPDDGQHKLQTWECCNFAYGELSKIIDVLPEPNELIKNNACYDLLMLAKNNNLDLENNPFVWKDGSSTFEVHGFAGSETDVEFEIREVINGCGCGWGLWKDLDAHVVKEMRDEMMVRVLHKSENYKKVIDFLSLQGNLYLAPSTYWNVHFTIYGTDMEVEVLSVKLDSYGKLILSVQDVDGQNEIDMEEKDIRPEYVDALYSYIDEISYNYDIIDTYNNHNPELVRKINAAWRSKKYHDTFGDILFALGCRDKQEIQEKFDVVIDCNETAMDNAHEIMEGVCDDWDLEMILSFIRYNE